MTEPETLSFRDRFSTTIWSIWIKPLIDYLTRFAELILLAAAFNVAAHKSGSLLLEGLAVVMNVACAFYSGVALSFFEILLDHLKEKSSKYLRPILVIVGLGISLLGYFISQQVTLAVLELTGTQAVG